MEVKVDHSTHRRMAQTPLPFAVCVGALRHSLSAQGPVEENRGEWSISVS